MGNPGYIQSVKVNFTFDELASKVSGEHNLGDLRLGDDGKLHRVNNHASLIGKLFNTQTTSPTENANVRMAVYSVIEAKFGNDAEAAPFLDAARDFLLGAGSLANPLSRKEARAIIGKFTAMTTNFGKLKDEIAEVRAKVETESIKRFNLRSEVESLEKEYGNRFEDATGGLTQEDEDAIDDYREAKAKYDAQLKDPAVKLFESAEKRYNEARAVLLERKASNEELDELSHLLKNVMNDVRIKDNPKIAEFKVARSEYFRARKVALDHVKSRDVIGAGMLDVAGAFIKAVAGNIKESVVNLFSPDSRAQLKKLEDKLTAIREQDCSVYAYKLRLRLSTPVQRTLNPASSGGMKNTSLGRMAAAARDTVAQGFYDAQNRIGHLDGNKPEQYRVATTSLLNELEHLRAKVLDPRLKAQLQNDIDALRQAFDRDKLRDYRALESTASRILMRMPEGSDKRLLKGYDFEMLAVRREVALAFKRVVTEGKDIEFSMLKPSDKNGLEQDQRSINTLRLRGNMVRSFSNALKAGLSPVVRESWNRASPAELKRHVAGMFSAAFKRTVDNLGFAQGSVPSLLKYEKDDFKYPVDDFCRQMCEDDSVSVNDFFDKFKDFVKESFAEAAKAAKTEGAGNEWKLLGEDFCRGLEDAMPEVRHFSGVLSEKDAKLVKKLCADMQRDAKLAFSPTVDSLANGVKPVWANLPSVGALPHRAARTLLESFQTRVSNSPELREMKLVDQSLLDRLAELADKVKAVAIEDEETLSFAEFVKEATQTIRDAAESNPKLRQIADSLAEMFSAASFGMDKMFEAANFADFCASNAAEAFTHELDRALADNQSKVDGAAMATIANAYVRSLEMLLPEGKKDDPSLDVIRAMARQAGKGAMPFGEFRWKILFAVAPGSGDSPAVAAFKNKVADEVKRVVNNGKTIQARFEEFDSLPPQPTPQYERAAVRLAADAYIDQLEWTGDAGKNIVQSIRELASKYDEGGSFDDFVEKLDKILDDARKIEPLKDKSAENFVPIKDAVDDARQNLEPLVVQLKEKTRDVFKGFLEKELPNTLCLRLEDDMENALAANPKVNIHLTAARVLTFALAEEVTKIGLGDCVDFKGMLALAERYVDGELGGMSFNRFVDLVSSTMTSKERQAEFQPWARELREKISQVMQDVTYMLDRYVDPFG